MTVDIVPALSDNYIYLLHVGDRDAICIDPAEADPVIAHLEAEGRGLSHILITHHHYDHTGGNEALKARYGCGIIGPDDRRVPALDRAVGEDDTIDIGPYQFTVFETPGHTSSHICLYLKEQQILFSGDTLFLGGCGRLFEGSAEVMWHSLQKLLPLPDETLIYCGHEYTASNLRFAASIEPGNLEVRERLQQLKNAGPCSMPGTLGEERRTNPFLRVADPRLQEALQISGDSPLAVFAALRAMKDAF